MAFLIYMCYCFLYACAIGHADFIIKCHAVLLLLWLDTMYSLVTSMQLIVLFRFESLQ